MQRNSTESRSKQFSFRKHEDFQSSAGPSEVDRAPQALYRETQLALREAVGAKDLDTLLVGKDALAIEVAEAVRPRATELGITVVTAGGRDVILPGDTKDLMNKVTEAKKAAKRHSSTRREETTAMRMQANTAKILESNPALMKLRKLEVLEKVAKKANLTVLLGDEGLANKVVKLLQQRGGEDRVDRAKTGSITDPQRVD